MSALAERQLPLGVEAATPAGERLARLAADPNLCHTSARWLAHEDVYPGRGALDSALNRRETDAVLLAEVRAAAAGADEKIPDDGATGYLHWLAAELAGALDRLAVEASR